MNSAVTSNYIDSMELSPSSEASSCLTTHHKTLALIPILSRINPICTTTSYLRSNLKLSVNLPLGLSSHLFSCGFPTSILYVLFFAHIRATCLAYLIPDFRFIIIVVLGEMYELWSSSFCRFPLFSCHFICLLPFHLSPTISSLFGPNILTSTPFSSTLDLCSY
jgi:hypothetical protein